MRFLIMTIPLDGHVYPFKPVAQELLSRGHEVFWYSSNQYKKDADSVGAEFVPYRAAPQAASYVDGLPIVDRKLSKNAFLREGQAWVCWFFDLAAAHYQDLREIVKEPGAFIAPELFGGESAISRLVPSSRRQGLICHPAYWSKRFALTLQNWASG